MRSPAAPISAASPPAPGRERLQALAREQGFDAAGIAAAGGAGMEPAAAVYERFIARGYAGEMAYLERRGEDGRLLRARIGTPFPWARSVIVCVSNYHSAAQLSTDPAPAGSAWISRYAWTGKRTPANGASGEGSAPSDYHRVLLSRLRRLEQRLREECGPFESRAYVDTGPVSERACARAAGLGWIGKNGCLIDQQRGSWLFLSVLVTSLVPGEKAAVLAAERCGSCTRCLEACPTAAIVAPGMVDARLCISYLTIEKRGAIADTLAAGMGRQVFGCDICQDVCPWNRRAPVSADAELATRDALVNPALESLAALDEQEWSRMFSGSPVRRARFGGFRRNLAIAMGNSGLGRFRARLERWAEQEPEEVAAAARFALGRLGEAGRGGEAQAAGADEDLSAAKKTAGT